MWSRLETAYISRIKDLREHFATYMLNHGLLREEIDLIQGRIGKSLFIKHYFSPAINDLKNRMLSANQRIISELRQKALN
jgi:intergrase/recombinase